ncbi:MAG: hypothetical protein HUJ25_00920 [Crocinitomicaceae bacterium]|nr:hypothetical protein [Crocinitomicaceae bacterium]
MNSRKLLYFLLVLFTFSCGKDTDDDASKKYVHVPPELPKDIYSKLQPGDCIIRKGNGPLSYHLMNTTKEDYSHCGVIVEDNDEWKVIHTLGGTASEDDIDGVQMCSVDEFVTHAADSMLFICRPVFMDSAGVKIAERAKFYFEEHTPFDHSFSLFSTDKLYCSELLFVIFRDVYGKNLFDIKKKHKSYMLMFSTFFDERRFEPVYHLKPNKEDWYVPHDYSIKEENLKEEE